MMIIFVEFFHFGSESNIIIMSESFLCFSFLIYLLVGSLQNIFSLNNSFFNVKYNYIYMFFKIIVNLKVYVHKNFINIFSYFLFLFLKSYKTYINTKNNLKVIFMILLFLIIISYIKYIIKNLEQNHLSIYI